MNGGPEGQFGNPPSPSSTGGGSSTNAESRVKGPAIGLMIAAGVGIFFDIISLILNVLGVGLAGLAGGASREEQLFSAFTGTVGIIVGIFTLIMGIVIIVGALRMKSLTSYGFAVASSVLAMIPCVSPCCILGLPIGIWALVVLLDKDVKAAFH